MVRPSPPPKGSVMKVYSDSELYGIYGVMNDPHFNAIRLRITTEPPVPPGAAVIENPPGAPGPLRGTSDAELGRHPE
jgi:hypothetical protein